MADHDYQLNVLTWNILPCNENNLDLFTQMITQSSPKVDLAFAQEALAKGKILDDWVTEIKSLGLEVRTRREKEGPGSAKRSKSGGNPGAGRGYIVVWNPKTVDVKAAGEPELWSNFYLQSLEDEEEESIRTTISGRRIKRPRIQTISAYGEDRKAPLRMSFTHLQSGRKFTTYTWHTDQAEGSVEVRVLARRLQLSGEYGPAARGEAAILVAGDLNATAGTVTSMFPTPGFARVNRNLDFIIARAKTAAPGKTENPELVNQNASIRSLIKKIDHGNDHKPLLGTLMYN